MKIETKEGDLLISLLSNMNIHTDETLKVTVCNREMQWQKRIHLLVYNLYEKFDSFTILSRK